jgi:hypothetical protein
VIVVGYCRMMSAFIRNFNVAVDIQTDRYRIKGLGLVLVDSTGDTRACPKSGLFDMNVAVASSNPCMR